MKTVTINPSVATEVHIDRISFEEDRPVFFRNDTSNWIGTYTLKIWNSPAKTTEYDVPEVTLVTVDNLITMTINPEGLTLPIGNLYYEIFNVEMKAIFFKGNLVIVK